MSVEAVDLSDVTSLNQILVNTPNGESVAKLAESLGLITSGGLRGQVARKVFIANVSTLDDDKLSDEQSYWTGQFGRIVEIVGLLQGQEKILSLQAKSVRAKARATARREAIAKELKPTAAQIVDEAEDNVLVLEVDLQASTIAVLLSSSLAAKEATLTYLSSLSREISFRCARMSAGVYSPRRT